MRSIYAVYAAIVLFAAAMTWVVLRGEDTRRDLKVIERTVDPCVHPRSDSCQRRIRLVLRELVKRHPGVLVARPKRSESFGSSEGVVPGTSPSGGGPIGRVPPGGSPPAPSEPNPAPEPDGPAIDLDVPLVPRTCVGDLLGVNCK